MYIWNNFLTKLIFFKLFAVNKITKLAFVNLEKDLRCFQIIILCLCNSYVLLYYKRYDLYNIIRNIWWSFVRNVHYVQIPWEIHILFETLLYYLKSWIIIWLLKVNYGAIHYYVMAFFLVFDSPLVMQFM